VIKLDLSRAAERLSRQHLHKVRVVNYSGSGIETTFTQGEDACLAAWLQTLPAAPKSPQPTPQSNLLIVGTLADVVEDQFRQYFQSMGIEQVDFFPPRRSTQIPAIGPHTRFLLAQPFLADTARQLEAQGATRLPAPFPLGAQGTTQWLKAGAQAFGVSDEAFEAVVRAPRQRAEISMTRHREQLQGRKIFFFPDSQLEIPLARFLAAELGMELIEVGTP
jgi:light-independent protochlorophyllide reductase subunit N